MNSEDARNTLAQAVDDFRTAHGTALGSMESALIQLVDAQEIQHTKFQKSSKRGLARAQSEAANQTIAAHSAARAAGLTTAENEDGMLRAARFIDLGELVVNAKRAGLNSPLVISLMVPLIGEGNISVFGAGPEAHSLMLRIQLEALRETAPMQLCIIGYDPLLANPLAPFSRLNAVADGIVKTTQDGKSLDRTLDDLTSTIARVGDLLQGSPTGLIEYRKSVGIPVEQFVLVSMHNYPEGVSEQQHARILRLAAAGPRHGISFVWHISTSAQTPAWFDKQDLIDLGESFAISSTRATWHRKPALRASIDAITPAQAAAESEQIARAATTASLPTVRFGDIQPDHLWKGSSADGVTFAIGRAGAQIVEITLGDEHQQKHNALVTGAVGQGKSNLLKVIIYSLCSRYSPDELSLFLLDFKEGVTLYPMAPTPGAPDFLPQASVIGLEADRDFGISTLAHLEKEFVRRARIFKPYGDNISKYRKANPDAKMPRIVLIVDEFHMLLQDDGDRSAKRAATLLEGIVRRGRSYGVHVILASQSISGISALVASSQGVFSQFPVRLGLKNSPAESVATFGLGNNAAANLRFRGEAILNLDYGAVSANNKVVIAAATDDELDRLRLEWFERISDPTLPTVFDGTSLIRLSDDSSAVRMAMQAMTSRTSSPRALIGRTITVENGPVSFPIERTPGRNLAVIGRGAPSLDDDSSGEPSDSAIGILQSAGLSLALEHAPGEVQFVVLDLLTERQREMNGMSKWCQSLTDLGHDFEVVPQSAVKHWISDEAKYVSQAESGITRYVFAFSLDRVGQIDVKDGLKPTVQASLHTIVRQGPTLGVHVFAWWSNAATFVNHMGLLRSGPFDGTVLLQGADEALARIHGPLTKWQGSENRGFFADASDSPTPVKIVPYCPVEQNDIDLLLSLRRES